MRFGAARRRRFPRCAWAAGVALLAILAAGPALADEGDSASGTLSRTLDDQLQLTVKNTGTTTLHYLRLDLRPGWAPRNPTMDGGTCGPGADESQFACSGFSLAPQQTLTVRFGMAGGGYPDGYGGTLHVSSGGRSDATSTVTGPARGEDCVVHLVKSMTTGYRGRDSKFHGFPWIEALPDRLYEYAVERDHDVEFEIRVVKEGPCPELVVRDLLPPSFKLAEATVISGGVQPTTEQESDRPKDLILRVPAESPNSVEWRIRGKFTELGDQTNQARLVSPGGGVVSNKNVIHAVYGDEVEKVRATARAIYGQASEVDAEDQAQGAVAAAADESRALSRPKLVEVAVRRLSGPGVKRCLWLGKGRASFRRTRRTGGRCSAPIWIKARGARHWRVRFKRRLPRGSYLLRARVTNVGGVTHTPSHGRFRIR